MERARRLAAALLAAAALAAGAPAARADVLRMENGKVMHGTVDRAFVDEHHLRIQLFSTGGTVRVRWEHLIAEDRERWQVDLGLKESAESQELKIDGHKLWFSNTAEPRLGLVLNPGALAEGSKEDVRLMARGREETYPRTQVVRVEPARMDLLLVYTPRQAYERKRDEIAPTNGDGHAAVGDYARLVGAYEEAKEHYLKAKEDADFVLTPLGKQLDSKLATLEVLVRNKALQQDIDRVRMALADARGQTDFGRAAQAFLKARDEMFRIMTQVTDRKLQAEFKMAELAQRIEADRRAFFQKRLPVEVYRWLRQKAYEKSGEKKVKDIPPGTSPQEKAALLMKGTFEGAKQYFTRQVTEDLWSELMRVAGASEALAQLQAIMEKDPAKITDEEKARAMRLAQQEKALREEIKAYWQDRTKSGFNVTTYLYGSFIVVKSDLKLQRKPPAAGGNQGGAKGGQQAVDRVKTQDEWWDEAPSAEKVGWLLSWYAERAGILEVIRAWDDPCDACSGLGYKKVMVAATGEEEAERCRLCNGCKSVRKVRWR